MERWMDALFKPWKSARAPQLYRVPQHATSGTVQPLVEMLLEDYGSYFWGFLSLHKHFTEVVQWCVDEVIQGCSLTSWSWCDRALLRNRWEHSLTVQGAA